MLTFPTGAISLLPDRTHDDTGYNTVKEWESEKKNLNSVRLQKTSILNGKSTGLILVMIAENMNQ